MTEPTLYVRASEAFRNARNRIELMGEGQRFSKEIEPMKDSQDQGERTAYIWLKNCFAYYYRLKPER